MKLEIQKNGNLTNETRNPKKW